MNLRAITTIAPLRPSKGGYLVLFADAFLAELAQLGNEAGGAYAKLLCAYWLRGGALEDDDKLLARLSGADGRWKRMRPEIATCFIVADGFWRHAHLDHERARWAHNSAKQSARARKRWANRS